MINIDTSSSKWAEWNSKSKEKKLTPTLAYTLKLFRENKTIEEIVKEREFKQDSIERQIIELITKSFIDILDIINEDKYNKIIQTLENKDLQTLKPIKEELGDNYSWFEIKAVIASINAEPKRR